MFNSLDDETKYSLLDHNFENNPRKLLDKIYEILTEMKFNYKD